ncbi:MAG TPA: hypothetical protein PL005_07045 [Candidatus Hydrogenedentes bacterium]|nr:hypothetical protein [Candidatus Hydrogenedentota bacterium]
MRDWTGWVLAGACLCALAVSSPAEEPAAGAPVPAVPRVTAERDVPPVIFVESPEDNIIKDHSEREALRKSGQLLVSFAVYENGAWRPGSNSGNRDILPVGTPLFSASDPVEVVTYGGLRRFLGYDDVELVAPFAHPKTKEEVLVSRVFWHSKPRPAADPPSVEEMKRHVLSALEPLNEEWKELRTYDCGRPYDPAKLQPVRLDEALEFELAPGEGAFFLTYQQPYSDVHPLGHKVDTPGYWRAIVRKEGLEVLCSGSWIKVLDYSWDHGHRLVSVADVNGDGVSEIITFVSGNEEWHYSFYQYTDHRLKWLFLLGLGPEGSFVNFGPDDIKGFRSLW